MAGASAGERLQVALLGASGYTGAEFLRLGLRHPRIEIVAVTGERQAGKPVAAVHPHLAGEGLPDLVRIEDVDFSQVDVAFAALPHVASAEAIQALPRSVRVIDLSADFRLKDAATYKTWYAHEHPAPAMLAGAVYGLTEHARAELPGARLVANPGCYPTASLLPLLPLLSAGLIEPDEIVIDAKSGVSGAGRELKATSLFSEVAEGFHAYGLGGHRHAPEIEQELSLRAGRSVIVAFTPHLIPVNRGMLATLYLKTKPGVDADSVRRTLAETYAGEPFVQVLPAGEAPQTRFVRGSNRCAIAVFPDRRPGRVLILSSIDNLVKGASGQAIQNLNAMMRWPETTGLSGIALFP